MPRTPPDLPGDIRIESAAPSPGAQTVNPALNDMPSYRAADRLYGEGTDHKSIQGFKTLENRERRLTNCQGVYKNNNCNSGDSYWQPTNGSWWNFPGIGGTAANRSGGSILVTASPGNPSGFDFVGGQTTGTTDPLNTFNADIVSSFSEIENSELRVINERTKRNCNCGEGGAGTTNYNCFNNCNCNCACACACDCDCSCFLPDTVIRLACGERTSIGELKVGDVVQGGFGTVNYVKTVVQGRLGDHPMYLINGELLTHPVHRFWCREVGFVCIDPVAAAKFHQDVRTNGLPPGLRGVGQETYIPLPEDLYPSKITIGMKLAAGSGQSECDIEVTSIHEINMPPETKLIEVGINNGSGMYQIGRHGLWTPGCPDYKFPFKDMIGKQRETHYA